MLSSIKRLNTGVNGLDDKMQGGLFENSVTLVTGKTGTGKTALCVSFLYAGVNKGEPGLYVTTEQREEDIKKDIESMFGWNLDSFVKMGLLKFLSIKPTFPGKIATKEDLGRFIKLYVFDLLERIEKTLKEIHAKRVVIDSVSIIEMFIKDEYLCRVAMIRLMDRLRELGVTSVVTGTIPEASEALSGGGIVEYIADGIIKLDFVPVAEEFKRTLTIRKMRRTNHSIYIHPFDITNNGLKLIEMQKI